MFSFVSICWVRFVSWVATCFAPTRGKENHDSTIFPCVFSSQEKDQGTAGGRMTEGRGIRSSTHRDCWALSGTVVIVFLCNTVSILILTYQCISVQHLCIIALHAAFFSSSAFDFLILLLARKQMRVFSTMSAYSLIDSSTDSCSVSRSRRLQRADGGLYVVVLRVHWVCVKREQLQWKRGWGMVHTSALHYPSDTLHACLCPVNPQLQKSLSHWPDC